MTGAAVARSFCQRLIQSIKDRVHPAYEYWGQLDPTREVNHKVSKEDMVDRVSQMYSGKVKIKKCPKAHSLKRPADAVRSCDLPLGCPPQLSLFTSCNFLGRCLSCRSMSVSYGAPHLFVRASSTSAVTPAFLAPNKSPNKSRVFSKLSS
jgi:hypothetical protein